MKEVEREGRELYDRLPLRGERFESPKLQGENLGLGDRVGDGIE